MAGFIYGGRSYRSTTSLVIVRVEGAEGWTDFYAYKGMFLPAGSDPFQVEQLLKDGAIEVFEEVAA